MGLMLASAVRPSSPTIYVPNDLLFLFSLFSGALLWDNSAYTPSLIDAPHLARAHTERVR